MPVCYLTPHNSTTPSSILAASAIPSLENTNLLTGSYIAGLFSIFFGRLFPRGWAALLTILAVVFYTLLEASHSKLSCYRLPLMLY